MDSLPLYKSIQDIVFYLPVEILTNKSFVSISELAEVEHYFNFFIHRSYNIHCVHR